MAVRRPTGAEQGVRPMGTEQEFGLGYMDRTGRFVQVEPAVQNQAMRDIIAGLQRAYPLVYLTGSSSAWGPNGSRMYKDLEHLEYSTAECTCLLELIAQIEAGRRMFAEAAVVATGGASEPFKKLVVIGNDYGLRDLYTKAEPASFGGKHTNYCAEKHDAAGVYDAYHIREKGVSVPHAGLVLATHSGSQIIYTGNGYPHFGWPKYRNRYRFLLSSRIPHITTLRFTSSRFNRSFLHMMKVDPYLDGAGNKRYCRLHDVSGNPSIGHVPMLLEPGTKNIMLRMAEEDPERFLRLPAFVDPVKAAQTINQDLEMRMRNPCTDGERRTALGMQWTYFTACTAFISTQTDDPPYVISQNAMVLSYWSRVLQSIESAPLEPDGLRDWPPKRMLFEDYLARKNVRNRDSMSEKAMSAIVYRDILYQTVTPMPGSEELIAPIRQKLVRLVTDEDIEAQVHNPPGQRSFPPIRSAARGQIVAEARRQSATLIHIGWEDMWALRAVSHLEGAFQTYPFPDVNKPYDDMVGKFQKNLAAGLLATPDRK